MKQQYCTISLLLLTLLFFLSCGSKDPIDYWGQNKQKEEPENNKETENKTDKPRYILSLIHISEPTRQVR